MASEQVDVQANAQATQGDIGAPAPANAQVTPGDIEAPAPVPAPVTKECEKEYMGRTGSEWLALMPALGAITLIVFGCMYFSDCSGIPSLAAYAIVFGACSILNGLIAIVFRTEKAKAAGGDGGAAGKVGALVGLAILGCAIWGAVITWGETSRFSDSPDCANQLYVAGFISSAIPCIIIAFMLLAFLGITLKKKYGSKGAEAPGSPMAKSAQEEQANKETSQA